MIIALTLDVSMDIRRQQFSYRSWEDAGSTKYNKGGHVAEACP
jgi:hypothetical protein